MNDYRLSFIGVAGDRRDPDEILDLLETTEVVILIDDSAAHLPETRVACERAADLIIRLFDHARLTGGAAWIAEVNDRISKIRPRAHKPIKNSVTIGIGGAKADVFVGFKDWSAQVSLEQAPDVSSAPVGALLAGPVIAGEAFKLVFAPFVPEIFRSDYEIDALSFRQASQAALEVPNDVDILIAGCGSVGFAVVDALVHWPKPLHGRVILLDNGFLEERNTYKYAWIIRDIAASGASKVAVLKERLETAHPGLCVIAHPSSVAAFEGDLPSTTIVSVDNVEGRRQAQDLLTKHVINVAIEATRMEIASITYGETACVYCYYHNSSEERVDYGVISANLGQPRDWVEQMLKTNDPLDDKTLRGIAAHSNSQEEPFLRFVGQPLRALLDRFPYSEAVLRVAEARLAVSAAFVSSLAGTLGLIEALKLQSVEGTRYRESLSADMMGIFHENIRKIPPKIENCAICNSIPRQKYYKKQWLGIVSN
jgi:hypothetical protein